MTVTSNNPLVHITATAGQQLFAANFEILRAEDAKVYQRIDGDPSNPIGTALELNVDYTITGVDNPTGFNVNLLVGANENDLITIDRDMSLDRETSFEESGTFTAKDLDEEFDKQTMMVQQVYSLIKQRGLTYNVDIDAKEGQLTIPELEAAEFWSANSEGNLVAVKIENTDVDALRSELSSQTELAPGSDDIGCWNVKTNTGQTLTELIDYVQSQQVIPTGSFIQAGATSYYGQFTEDQYVMARNTSIGNANSNATERANDDTKDLFIFLWEQQLDITSFQVYDSGGTPVIRSVSAIDDWNANRAMRTGLISQRSIGIAGSADASLTARIAGSVYGAETHTLIESEMPSHTHDLTITTLGAKGGEGVWGYFNQGSSTTSATGGNVAHNNMPPTVYLTGFWKL